MRLTAYENGKAVLEKAEKPACGQGEVLLRVKACGICGSDIPRVLNGKAYYYPIVVGHEFSGIVEEARDENWIGKRACVFPILPCKTCEYCQKGQYANCIDYNYYGSRRDGGLQEHIAIKEENLVPLPESVSYEAGAMIEPLAVCLHAVKKAEIRQGDTVVIYGAGTIGLLCGAWAKDFGAGTVYFVDIDENKLAFAETLGFRRYDGEGVQVAIEASGAGACLNQAINALQPFGRLVIVGNPSRDMTLKQANYGQILRKQLRIEGSWNSDFSQESNDWKESVQAVAEKRIIPERLITHTVPFAQSEDAFAIARNGEFYNKIMVVME